MERLEKKIEMSLVNKIKHLQVKMMEYGDDENYVGQRNCENHLFKYIAKYPPELREELLDCINWYNDNCVSILEKMGWEVIRGK